jgi:glycerophosphoryl diester phosphodiesterase
VSDFTAAELGQIDVGTWFNQRHPSRARKNFLKQTIPSLAQVFELMYGYEGLIYVEMKCESSNHCDLATATADLIRDFKFESRVVVKSFEHESLIKMKSYAPEIRTAALFSPRPLRVLHPGRELINPTIECSADEISLHYTLARKRTISKATLAELPTVIWTADHPVWVKRAIKLGIYAIITNNPVRLLARRNQLLVKHNSRILIPRALLE